MFGKDLYLNKITYCFVWFESSHIPSEVNVSNKCRKGTFLLLVKCPGDSAETFSKKHKQK